MSEDRIRGFTSMMPNILGFMISMLIAAGCAVGLYLAHAFVFTRLATFRLSAWLSKLRAIMQLLTRGLIRENSLCEARLSSNIKSALLKVITQALQILLAAFCSFSFSWPPGQRSGMRLLEITHDSESKDSVQQRLVI